MMMLTALLAQDIRDTRDTIHSRNLFPPSPASTDRDVSLSRSATHVYGGSVSQSRTGAHNYDVSHARRTHSQRYWEVMLGDQRGLVSTSKARARRK
jgi:hypothetical protein